MNILPIGDIDSLVVERNSITGVVGQIEWSDSRGERYRAIRQIIPRRMNPDMPDLFKVHILAYGPGLAPVEVLAVDMAAALTDGMIVG